MAQKTQILQEQNLSQLMTEFVDAETKQGYFNAICDLVGWRATHNVMVNAIRKAKAQGYSQDECVAEYLRIKEEDSNEAKSWG